MDNPTSVKLNLASFLNNLYNLQFDFSLYFKP